MIKVVFSTPPTPVITSKNGLRLSDKFTIEAPGEGVSLADALDEAMHIQWPQAKFLSRKFRDGIEVFELSFTKDYHYPDHAEASRFIDMFLTDRWLSR